ncbi:hypothetical protein ACROYT_G022415 [Oculina patagonica]
MTCRKDGVADTTRGIRKEIQIWCSCPVRVLYGHSKREEIGTTKECHDELRSSCMKTLIDDNTSDAEAMLQDLDSKSFPEVILQLITLKRKDNAIHQGPVVQRLDNAIHRINRYPVDKS